MKLNFRPLHLIIVFGCGMFWNAVPALAVPMRGKTGELTVTDNVSSRTYRDVGAVIWPMTWKADNEKPAEITRSVRAPESMAEAIIMIDDFWRTLANDADTEDNLEEKFEQDVKADNSFIEENVETNDEKEKHETNDEIEKHETNDKIEKHETNDKIEKHETNDKIEKHETKDKNEKHETNDKHVEQELSDKKEKHEQITSRFSSDSYQEDVQSPQQHLPLYPPNVSGYAPPNIQHGNYLLRPPPPSPYHGTVPWLPYYGNAAIPMNVPIPNQDSELDMEFYGNRVPIGRSSMAYPHSMPQQSQYPTLQYPPVHPQLVLHHMINTANHQNLHMNPGTPPSSQIGSTIQGVTKNKASSSIPQSSYPILGYSPANLPGVSTYPYHQ